MEEIRKEIPEKVIVLLEKDAMRYHLAVCWVAFALNPIFSITDYHNIGGMWKELFAFRVLASIITLVVIWQRHRFGLNSSQLIVVPFALICFENSAVYLGISPQNIEGQNLNFMAMFIASGMFLLWRWEYSLGILLVATLLTSFFIHLNPEISYEGFFVSGGLLLITSGVFMAILIQTRYRLTLKTITAQVLLQESNKALAEKALEIRLMNESLEQKVIERTQELIKKNTALEEYAFVNSHKLRSPVANILGLVRLLTFEDVKPSTKQIIDHLEDSSEKLDIVVKETTKKLNS